MRISDWSSDVCSSDLQDKSGRKPRIGEVEHENERIAERLHPRPAHKANELERARGDQQSGRDGVGGTRNPRRQRQRGGRDPRPEIGRGACRERVGQYVEISVVAVSLKTKKKKRTEE